jgi:hypothetical protein
MRRASFRRPAPAPADVILNSPPASVHSIKHYMLRKVTLKLLTTWKCLCYFIAMCKYIIWLPFLFLLAFATMSSKSYAECLACWNLNSCEVELKDNKTVTGYIPWNSTVIIYHEDGRNSTYMRVPFDSIADNIDNLLKAKINTLTLYPIDGLVKVQYPYPGLLVAFKEPLKINTEDIVGIKRVKGKYDGIGGAGSVQFVERTVARKLIREKPLAQCNEDSGVSEEYWLSYNPDIGREDLKCMCERRKCSKTERERIKNSTNVYHISVSYD